MIAEREQEVKKTLPMHIIIDLISHMTILLPMHKRLLIMGTLSILVFTSCALQRAAVGPFPGRTPAGGQSRGTAAGPSIHKVTVEPGSPGMLPWERPYSVDENRYVPMLHAEGYRAEGLASWYGEEEHGKPTSNGETFDMYKLTAAHKILPLGSYVKVTNKSNGRQTVVRLNDRGPFVADRIIDLSYQAAKDLDMIDYGVMPVSIEVLPSAPASPATAKAPSFSGKTFTLQVAAYSDRETAKALSERLKKEFEFSFIEPVQTDKGFFYRVHAGRFKTREDAEAAKMSFARRGFPDAFIVSRQ